MADYDPKIQSFIQELNLNTLLNKQKTTATVFKKIKQ